MIHAVTATGNTIPADTGAARNAAHAPKMPWLQGRLAEVLPVPYAHLVFTLPHSLNGLYAMHPRWVIDTLFTCAALTLAEFAANPKWMGCAHGTPAFSLVLHTWSQDLQRHIHVHAVMACGVLDKEGQWATPTRKPNFLFPVQALSRVFRGKFMAVLVGAHNDGGTDSRSDAGTSRLTVSERPFVEIRSRSA